MNKKQIFCLAVFLSLGILFASLYAMQMEQRTHQTEKINHWKKILITDLPIGSSQEKIELFGAKHHLTTMPNKDYYKKTIGYDIVADTVPVDPLSGFPFCALGSKWPIVIQIFISDQRIITKERVSTVNSCL